MLAEVDPRQARIVELRFFAGMIESEIAGVLGVSEITVKRDWRSAKAWLRIALGAEGRPDVPRTMAADQGGVRPFDRNGSCPAPGAAARDLRRRPGFGVRGRRDARCISRRGSPARSPRGVLHSRGRPALRSLSRHPPNSARRHGACLPGRPRRRDVQTVCRHQSAPGGRRRRPTATAI